MEFKYRPEIDGLRTIAVVSVIIYHAEFTLGSNHLLKGGFLGVDIFFVISGFLITSLIMMEYQRTGRFSIANFYERRIRRILPALLTVMLVSLPFAWNILFPTQLVEFSKSLIASLLFASNFFWHDVLGEYGTESALLKPFLHTWSLAVEEQYYIIFPLIIVAIYQWRKTHAIALLTAGFIASLEFAQWATVEHPSFSFYMLPSRFWELLAGALVANILYFHPQKDNDVLLNRTMPVIGLFLIFHSIIFTGFGATHPGFITVIPVVGTVLIIWFANENDLVTKFLSSKLFVGIGLISYSLYLWHYPIFAFGRINNFNPSSFDKFCWILLTFILSIASYFLIEKPFRSKNTISRKTMFTWLLVAIVIVSMYSFYTIQNNGIKERFPTLTAKYGKNEFDNKILQKASWTILEKLAKSRGMEGSEPYTPSVFESEQLWFSNKPSTKKILIVGDSHSKDLFNAFYQNKDIFSNLEFSRFGMNNSLFPEQLKKLYASPNFAMSDIIVISFRYTEDTVKGISKLIKTIENKAKKVRLVLNITELNDINGRPVYDGYLESHYQDVSIKQLRQAFFDNRNNNKDQINESLSAIAKNKGIVILDKTDFICDMNAKTCDGVTDDGYKSFYDYGHFTLEGAKYFGQRIHEINWLKID